MFAVVQRHVHTRVCVVVLTIDVQDLGSAVVHTDCELWPGLLRILYTVPDDIREVTRLTVHKQPNRLEGFAVRGTAAAAEAVAVYVDGLRVGIECFRQLSLTGVVGAEVARDEHVGRLIVVDRIVEDLDFVVGVDDHPGSGRNPGYRRARYAEVWRVVVGNPVVVYPRAVAGLG